MTLPKYPSYKQSDVEWVGSIPENWFVIPLKWLVRQVTDKAKTSSLQLGLENIESGTGKLIETDVEFSGDGIAFAEGDILFGKLRPYLAKAWMADCAGEAVGDFFVLRPELMSPRFLASYILCSPVIDQLSAATIGAKMPRVGWGTMASLPVCVPPEEEQTQLARFLDYETARIDALIEEQQRLIELLKEKRQAVISHAVTKGLDPNVPMKDSGVEWLGEVPTHWEISPLKHIVSIPVTDGPHETPEFLDEGILFISAEAVSSGTIDFSKAKYISHEDHKRYSKKYAPKKHDIYMVKSGATTGVTAIVETEQEFNIWSPLAVIRTRHNFEPKFVLYFMRSRSFLQSVTLFWSYGTQQNIGMGVIENLPIAVPPPDEQKQIAKYLDEKLDGWSKLIDTALSAVELLVERRASLISAAVTGKIDVRNWQPPAKSKDQLLQQEVAHG